MSLTEAVRALKAERRTLEADIKRIDRAIDLLQGEAGLAQPTAATKGTRPARKQTAPWSGPVEAVTCPHCGIIAKTPAGLSSHVRLRHTEAAAVGQEDAAEVTYLQPGD